MSRNDPRIVQRLAEAVAARTPVDWEAEAHTHPEMEAAIRDLELMDTLASLHRSPHRFGARFTGSAAELERWGTLEVKEEIDGGEFGAIYRAHDATLRRDVALKLLHASLARDELVATGFLKEAQRLARVRHENVLTVHGAAVHDGRPGMWTDLIAGRSLESILEEDGTFGPEEAAVIGQRMCAALAAVHAAGIVHRDVKTENIMRAEGGSYVLMDFGAATRTVGEESDRSISGTPLFMAPELFHGEPATPRSDLYALGVVLYRLVTGSLPVETDSLEELRERHRQGAAMPLLDRRPDLPASFAGIVQRALEPDPRRRFQSAGQMAEALAAFLGTPSVRRSHAPLWRRPVPIALAAAALALTALAVGLLREPAPPVSFELHRVGASGDERILPGSPVRPGDELYLTVETTDPANIYVLYEDEHGAATRLFPETAQQNPVPAGTHRLPALAPGGVWRVTPGDGMETFQILSSPTPIPPLEPMATRGTSAPAPELLDPAALRAIQGSLVGQGIEVPDPRSARPLSEILLAVQRADRDDLRAWRIPLDNAPPRGGP